MATATAKLPTSKSKEKTRPKFPSVYTTRFVESEHAFGFVKSLEWSMSDNPSIAIIGKALGINRNSGRYIKTYYYIIPTGQLVTIERGHLTWEDVEAANNKRRKS